MRCTYLFVVFRARRMMAHLPRLVELLESREEIAAIRPLTKSYKSHKLYQSQVEKDLLRQGHPQSSNVNSFEPLLPGSLYLNCFLVGIGFHERKYHQAHLIKP
jgi:hypothetical protein